MAPHPDDETIGAYGLIRRLRSRRSRVSIVVVTDGAGSHAGSLRWPRDRLIAERRRETLAAMRSAGLDAGDVRFLGLPDGSLSSSPRNVRRAVTRVACATRPDLLVLPAADDDHPDHRAIASAMRPGRWRTLHYLVWPNRLTRSRAATHFLPLGPIGAAKRGAILHYRTQMGLIRDDPDGFAISPSELARFARPIEFFRGSRR
ncbi:PIG-L family deacetylase [Sphingomonas sp. 1P06PA]|uniref:PIG-L deacetylase family protein n=1 Tax=Sphingomonas sp. 1P06PA TaxID=554121 RepID=UPI0039A76BD6